VIRVRIVASAVRRRRALEAQLQAQGLEIAGSFAAIEDAGESADDGADVLLLDGGEAGVEELLESLMESSAEESVACLLLASLPHEDVSRILRAGVRGVLPAESSPQALSIALEAVAQGLLVLDPREAAVVSTVPAPTVETGSELEEALTSREKEVLGLLAEGLGNKEIAARLGISDHTAKFHVASILGKLGAASRTEAVSIGMRRGLILL
jgi:NarL family two-component system response regulator YdfI